jgi:hypothetical protein
MNFLVFWHFAFIISKKICLHLFELIKDEAALKVRYFTRCKFVKAIYIRSLYVQEWIPITGYARTPKAQIYPHA